MAPTFDQVYDTAPLNTMQRARGPKIVDLKAALTTFSASSYPPDLLNGMTKNDLVHACVVHNLAVPGV